MRRARLRTSASANSSRPGATHSASAPERVVVRVSCGKWKARCKCWRRARVVDAVREPTCAPTGLSQTVTTASASGAVDTDVRITASLTGSTGAAATSVARPPGGSLPTCSGRSRHVSESAARARPQERDPLVAALVLRVLCSPSARPESPRSAATAGDRAGRGGGPRPRTRQRGTGSSEVLDQHVSRRSLAALGQGSDARFPLCARTVRPGCRRTCCWSPRPLRSTRTSPPPRTT